MADQFSGTGADSAGGGRETGTRSVGGDGETVAHSVRDGSGSAGMGDGGEGMQRRAHELQQAARESGRDLLDQAVEKKDELKARAGSALDDGRHRASERVGSVARALHSTAENLEREGEGQLSHWVHQAADQVDRVVGYLDGRDANGLFRDMEDMARRNPALFLGGTYAAGLVLGRFLRASSPESRAEHESARGEPGSARTGDDRAVESEAGSPWTGVGVSRESFGTSAGYGATGHGAASHGAGAARGTVPLSGSTEGAGLTDEDLREAWHREEGAPDEGMRGARREGRSADDLDTGELTRYTDGDADRSRED